MSCTNYMGHETVDGSQEITEKQNLGSSINEEKGQNSCKSDNVSEAVIMKIEELPNSNSSISCKIDVESMSNRCQTSSVEAAIVEDDYEGKDGNKSWVVDVKCGEGEIWEGERERVCRICHLSSEQGLKKGSSGGAKSDLIQLGCGCKDELSVAHSYCAEAWFKLKGNRMCEICGEIVNNVRGVGDERFMEEWKENRTNGNAPADSSDTTEEGCLQGQPFCNFLMGCLVIAFVLPWFFRINMF